VPGAKVLKSEDVGMRLDFDGHPEMDQLGLAFYKLLAAEIINPSHKDALMTAERLLKNHGIGENIAPKEAVAYLQHFMAYVKTAFKPNRILAEYPAEHVTSKGQITHFLRTHFRAIVSMNLHFGVLEANNR
jgi:hypothetical protein